MKNLGKIVMTATLTALVGVSTQVYGQGTKILLIPREGYSVDLDLTIKMDVGVMKLLLKNSDPEVHVANTTGIHIVGTIEKITDIKQSRNVKIDDYVGVIVACMAVGGGCQLYPPVPAEVIAIVKKALADGKPVAANGNAAVVLAEAGGLKVKKFSYVRDPLKATATIPVSFATGLYETFLGVSLTRSINQNDTELFVATAR